MYSTLLAAMAVTQQIEPQRVFNYVPAPVVYLQEQKKNTNEYNAYDACIDAAIYKFTTNLGLSTYMAYKAYEMQESCERHHPPRYYQKNPEFLMMEIEKDLQLLGDVDEVRTLRAKIKALHAL